MRRRATLLVLLGGCQASRVAEVESEIATLSRQIESTEQVVQRMQTQLDRHRQANGGASTADRMPPGFDPTRPLPSGDARKPDVIVLSIDTLRADHLGSWGYARDTSPHLDALAAGGTRFANTWSPSPWTLPSHATMLSGLLPPNHSAIEDTVRVGDGIPLLQEAFQSQGYATAGVVSTLFVSRRFGFERGFDWFHDFEITEAAENNAATVDAEHVFAWATQWAADQPAGEPIFLFLHVYDAHYAYNAPPPFNERFDRAAEITDPLYKDYQHYRQNPLSAEELAHQIAQYDEEIAYIDHSFDAFLSQWRAQRQAVVVVTSDHGEELGERGSWGHAHTLFPEQLHVPWIVNGPGVRAQVVADRVGTEDLPATLADLAGVDFPAGDGVSRAAQLRGGGAAHTKVAAQFASTSRFRTNRYRWHEPPWDLFVDLAQAKRALCNLQTDPGCTNTGILQDKPRSEAMFEAMMAWLGHPWEATASGTVQVKGGVIYDGAGRRQRQAMVLDPGVRFAVFPADAQLRFVARDGQTEGPWAAVGGALPEAGASLRFHGRDPGANTAVNLTEDESAMLEALGYLQDN